MDTTTFSGEGRHVDEAIRWFHHPFTLAVLTGVSFGPMNVVLCCTTDFSIFQVVFSIDKSDLTGVFFCPQKLLKRMVLQVSRYTPAAVRHTNFFLALSVPIVCLGNGNEPLGSIH